MEKFAVELFRASSVSSRTLLCSGVWTWYQFDRRCADKNMMGIFPGHTVGSQNEGPDDR